MESELDRLEHRAQEVRERLAADLDELILRLQPHRVMRNVVAQARDMPASRGLGRDIVRNVRHNPIPYLLFGIGITGLVWAMTSFSRTRTASRLPEFSEADFAPPRSPRAPAASPVGPAVSTASAIPPAASRQGPRPAAAPEREVDPAGSAER